MLAQKPLPTLAEIVNKVFRYFEDKIFFFQVLKKLNQNITPLGH